MKLAGISALLFLLFAACSSSAAEEALLQATGTPSSTPSGAPTPTATPTVSEKQAELAQNEEKWRQAGIVDYSFRLSIGCFCPYSILGPLDIQVIATEVSSIATVNGVVLSPDAPEYNFFSPYVTVERLFSTVEAHLGIADEVNVTYDDQYGFPTTVFIDNRKLTTDDELFLRVSAFEIGAAFTATPTTAPSPTPIPGASRTNIPAALPQTGGR